jgi:prepilin-type N-terminal cleavage/methylation domain-containing protein
MLKKIIKSERGITLVEVLVALALLGLIAATFLMAISTATKAIYIADERTTAESLARSQLEYVKEQEYDENDTQSYEQPDVESPTHQGYYISVDADPLRVPDDGIQKITVTVKHYDKEIIILEGYKVDDSVY